MPLAEPSHDASAQIDPTGAAKDMYAGLTYAELTARMIGTTAGPSKTPKNSRIQPIEIPE